MKTTVKLLVAMMVHAGLAGFCVADDPAPLHVHGVIGPYRRVVLRSPIDSRVLRISSATGQEVAAQTVLVELDTRPLERELSLAEAQLAEISAQLKACELGLERIGRSGDRLREEVERAKGRLEMVRRTQPPPGYPGRIVRGESTVMRSPQRESLVEELDDGILDAAATKVRIRTNRSRLLSLREKLLQAEHAAAAATRITRQRIDQAAVTTDFKGVIARYLVDPSQAVSAGDELVEVIQTDRLKATLWLPDKLAAAFDPRQRPWSARVRGSNTETPWQDALVRGITPLPHPQMKQIMFEIEVDNSGGILRAGMSVDAILTASDVAQASSKRSLK